MLREGDSEGELDPDGVPLGVAVCVCVGDGEQAALAARSSTEP